MLGGCVGVYPILIQQGKEHKIKTNRSGSLLDLRPFSPCSSSGFLLCIYGHIFFFYQSFVRV